MRMVVVLPAAVGPQEAEDLAFADGEVNPVHGVQGRAVFGDGENLCQSFGLNSFRHHFWVDKDLNGLVLFSGGVLLRRAR